ncbi:hypothetical protein FSP39_006613 [Pinctada imbricata]|uniref:G-protein coupled receptors family 1 profile domain-containing protein n=1 Tax=Pinctada imbricata TaxID=66713 RepID=A0AA89BN22_PINIB|nr:hypothetical protein FSP39_006613 [Pinctada imbricata]
MLNFLIDNIFVVFGGKVFQQIVGIPMGTNCAPLLADIFLYSYEAEFILSLVSEGKRYLAFDFNFTYRYIDDVLSINNPKFTDYLSSIYPSELEVKETTETNNSASYLDIMLSYDTDGHMKTSLYDKRDDFNFSITNFPFLSSNIPSSPAYGVFISQLIRYARASTKYTDFVLRARRLSDKLLSQGYVCDRLTSSLRKFYGRYGELVIHYDVPLSKLWMIFCHRPFEPSNQRLYSISKLLRYIMIVCLAVNVMTLVAIGVDRLLVVVFPLFSKPYRKKKYAYICVIGLWVISFIIFTPFLNITKEIRVGRPYCIEQLDEHSRFVYAILMFVVFYAIPQIFLGTCYTIISLKLWNSKYSSEMNQVAIVTLKIKGKIVKLTFAIILAFAVCWLPMHIGALLNAKSGGSEFNYYLQLFAPCFAYTTVSLNPIIYCFMSKSLRKSLKSAIHCDDHTIKQRKAKPLLLQMQM